MASHMWPVRGSNLRTPVTSVTKAQMWYSSDHLLQLYCIFLMQQHIYLLHYDNDTIRFCCMPLDVVMHNIFMLVFEKGAQCCLLLAIKNKINELHRETIFRGFQPRLTET